jgi:hypothetical protein
LQKRSIVKGAVPYSDWPSIWVATLAGIAAAMQVGKAAAALRVVAGAALLGLMLVTRVPTTLYGPQRSPA